MAMRSFAWRDLLHDPSRTVSAGSHAASAKASSRRSIRVDRGRIVAVDSGSTGSLGTGTLTGKEMTTTGPTSLTVPATLTTPGFGPGTSEPDHLRVRLTRSYVLLVA